MSSDALISKCGQYRYWLRRGDMGGIKVCFVMLNPSTADAETDDRTVSRCIRFTKDWGGSGLTILNLYAYRSTDPKNLKAVADPVGPENEKHWRELLPAHDVVVCAWGANAEREAVERFVSVANELGVQLYCLATTKDGQPRHPLYLKSNLKPVPWLIMN